MGSLLLTKLKRSLINTLSVLQRPSYFLLALGSGFVMMIITTYSLSFDTLWHLLFRFEQSLLGKYESITYGYRSLFGSFDSLLALSILLFTTMFGVTIALLVYQRRHSPNRSQLSKSTGGGFALALLGSGCVSCGTSLLAPLLVSLGVSSTAAIYSIGAGFNLLAAAVLMYSAYKLSLLVVPQPG